MTDLSGLFVSPAPASLLPSVLYEVGLADRFFLRPSPLGPVFVAYNRSGVSACSLVAAEGAQAFAGAFAHRFGRPALPDTGPPDRLVLDVDAALAGRPSGLRYDLRTVSEFGRAVLAKAAEIPRGQVRPYAWIAAEIGRPKAVRAVGTALGHNPVPLLIPCHRVVRSDGRIGDYGLGSPAKRAVLAAEGVELDELGRLAARRAGRAGN
ncbi:MAG: methylated-DNA--[protein]-cysteine S-methyltransferase [Actinobacteria bacterium]|nr:methylated-DNA--[protein]-cysteine S-methyltransferase [Actinomycetota bacterium]